MPLYQIDQNRFVSQIKPASFSKERELQKLFEANMDALMGVRFIASEVHYRRPAARPHRFAGDRPGRLPDHH
jgi:hypothetical protein